MWFSLDDCDSLIEEGIHSKQFRSKVRQKLDLIGVEFKYLNDLVINLEKTLRIDGIFGFICFFFQSFIYFSEMRQSNLNYSIKSDELNQNPDSLTKPSKIEEYIVTDQVFEAIVTEDYDQNDIEFDPKEDQLWEMRVCFEYYSKIYN